MTYLEKLQLIEKLKNFVSPFDGHGVFFNFYSQSEFVLEFLTEETVKLEIDGEFSQQKHRAKLPYAVITYDLWQHEILYYCDLSLSYYFNLTSQQLVYFSHVRTAPICPPEEMGKELDRLIKRLKNS